MFLFDWKKIYKKTNGKLGPLYTVFKMLVRGEVPKNKYDRIYKYYNVDYSGQSFLLNPDTLLDNAHKYTTKEIVEYIALASYRRYSEYLATKKTTLSLLESPVGKDKINKNRLLSIDTNGEIHFLYEEVNKRGK